MSGIDPADLGGRADHCDLTICTVSNSNGTFVKLNVSLTRALNKGSEPSWVVVENAQSEPLPEPALGRVVTARGPAADLARDERARGSYHHAAGIHRALDLAESRFVLVLDPDFYVVREGWVREVVEHMKRLRLAFFGVPWHPRWIAKIRYFPAPHCIFIDRELVPEGVIDFTPEIWYPKPGGSGGAKGIHGVGEHLRESLRPLAVVRAVGVRRSIGGSRDTGYRIYRAAAAGKELRVECALPVFDPRTDLSDVPWASAWWSRMADVVLPDRLRIEPGRRESFTTLGFKALGEPDVRGLGWEEFMWKGTPFGFHLRWSQLAGARKDAAPDVLGNVVRQVLRDRQAEARRKLPRDGHGGSAR